MATDPTDEVDVDRPARGGSDGALTATSARVDGSDHGDAIAAAIASQLDERDDSRAFSADELRTAARGVVAAVGPEATDAILAWAWELVELLDPDEDEFVDRYAAMVAWRLVERFDDRRGRNRSRSGAAGEGAAPPTVDPAPTVDPESGDGGADPPPEAPRN